MARAGPLGVSRAPSGVLARAVVRVPATCGELIQGTLGGVPFHISSPIDLYTTVAVELTAASEVVVPPGSPKTARAVRVALEHFGAAVGVRVAIASEIPRSKGMASSTADVVGAIGATGLALGYEADALVISRLALEVEPTDGSAFPGVVLFDHVGGRLFEPLGGAPDLAVLVLDFGGEVDTVSFNAVDRSALLRELEPGHAEAMALARRGLAERRLDLVGRAATLSAQLNQRVLPKPELPAVLAFADDVGALGVCVGHSGTVLGALLPPDRDAERLAAAARAALPGLSSAIPCRLVGGGVEVVEVRSASRART